ncbi:MULTISPECIES: M20 peptidase aminoacylase family protein [Peribacillus]|uniref:M20 peptidase aminoacylase family protein n=1 Tax=Peribacillus TaxID=2675229 RepID=UPI000AFA52AA|nr:MULTISPECIES: M20 peptidase aminoacylase family protein [Peribacillus]MBK5445227.1 M20 peptidase aminoacylase family protein [Peribacillus sp. TH24]MBK5460049.1 M20 peptidase aminoacylase family protein [Peribacillus sp. TH27]MBK5481863.1 M20 peptidase aminoacylase family protein [Peribacillus sp. TH16]MBK5498240.1 M20 peptidase aminoacylase family protein [Peribacillus sp. TH14]WMX56643.1 M20 peptidase aminoacylase family protein [Peribacillus sp. R9-11]
MDITQSIEKLRPRIIEIFDHLHSHPETSWNEVNTTAFISNVLKENQCSVKKFKDCTGVIGEIGNGSFTVGLRSDIDALWQEVHGSFQANHSCGHDGHMTLALGVFLVLKEMNFQPKGKLKFIFQPAEEKGTGALKMIDEKVVDDVDFLYGVHLRPAEEVKDGQAAPAIVHGAAQFIKGEIVGTDAHGARPHQGQNAIEIGASFVTLLNNIHLNPSIPFSAKMTQFFAGGESSNIIPGKATFSLDLRAQDNEVMKDLTKRVEKVAEALAVANGVEINLESGANVAAAIVNNQAQEIMAEAIADTLGKENLVAPVITTGGEDFHFYTLKKPEIKATMLGLGCDLTPGLHHPNMTFNKEALLSGIEILTKAIILTFEKYGEGERRYDK